MIRLFVEHPLGKNVCVDLTAPQAHYLCHVMRLKQGDLVSCFNGLDGEWSAEIQMQKKCVILQTIQQLKQQQVLPECVLCPALIKKESMDFIWQKATELGVTKIYPVLAERSVVKNFNQKHAESVVREACEQCERLDIPQIYPPETLEDLLSRFQSSHHIIWLSERGKNARHKSHLSPAFFVGPEGGWTQKEQEKLRSVGADEWHIGQTILRAETACLAALAIYQGQSK